MTVTDLIEWLGKVPDPDQTIIVQSIDSEGNSIRNTAEADASCAFRPDGAWSGDLLIRGPLTPELARQGYSEEDMADDASIPCVCLWPVN